MDIDQRLSRLKADIALAQQSRAAAAQGAAVAADREQQAVAALKLEFGVTTPEEAAALAAQLEHDLEQEVSAVEAALARAEEK